jgi:hypothetical protein
LGGVRSVSDIGATAALNKSECDKEKSSRFLLEERRFPRGFGVFEGDPLKRQWTIALVVAVRHSDVMATGPRATRLAENLPYRSTGDKHPMVNPNGVHFMNRNIVAAHTPPASTRSQSTVSGGRNGTTRSCA